VDAFSSAFKGENGNKRKRKGVVKWEQNMLPKKWNKGKSVREQPSKREREREGVFARTQNVESRIYFRTDKINE
jgi:hypothetical protein